MKKFFTKLFNVLKRKETITIIISFMLLITVTYNINEKHGEPKEMKYQEFTKMIEKDQIKSVNIIKNADTLEVKATDGKLYTMENPNYDDFKKELMESGVKVSTTTPKQWSTIISSLVSILIYGGIFYMVFSSMKGGFGGKRQEPVSVPDTKFSDIAGYTEQKEDLQTYVDYLKNPKSFSEKGAHMPKGILLYGPPGTGKTLFARAVAGEAGVPFYSVSGSDFVEMFVGLGAKRVRSLFEQARQKAPCIIFIDEIDAIGGKRNGLGGSEQNQTINALLTELDGFKKDTGILVLATTNHPEHLDAALTRSGRFDNHISIPLPSSQQDREAIINVHIKNRKFADDVDFSTLAKEWIGFSGADIESILNEASILAARQKLDAVSKSCIDEAFYKKVLKGHVKKKGQSERSLEELELVAYHEAGHAVARELLGVGEVSKVTILSTTNGAGGVTFHIPKKMGLFTMEELENEVKILYAGRAAEYLLNNKDIRKVTTGASNDIERATDILTSMVMEYGLQHQPMLLDFKQIPEGKEFAFEEIKWVAEDLFNQIVELLEKNYELLSNVANRLLEKETIEANELDEMVTTYLSKQKQEVA